MSKSPKKPVYMFATLASMKLLLFLFIVLLCQMKKLNVMISVKQVSEKVLNITKDFLIFLYIF